MGRILEKAQRHVRAATVQEILDYLGSIPKEEQITKEELIRMIHDVLLSEEQPDKQEQHNRAWDFSQEKASPVFCEDGTLVIRPFRESDKSLYYSIARQYALGFLKGMFSEDKDLLWHYTQKEYAFYCVIENASVPIGYVAIKDTRKKVWEVAIELEPRCCHLGYGPKSLLLFLGKMSEISGEHRYCAKVEVDNLASQKCMDKTGAELIGITDGILKGEAEKEEFESKYLDCIDERLLALAATLGVKPQKLLSHVLEYRIVVQCLSAERQQKDMEFGLT